MVANQHSDPEFDQKCQSIRHQWETGVLSFKDAVALLSDYAQSAADSGSARNESMAQLMLGILQHYRGNLNRSIQHYNQARKLAVSVDDKHLVARVDLNQGENYRFKGDINHALHLYMSAFNMAEDIGHIQIQTIAAVNEGLVLVASSQYTMARRVFQTALALTEQWAQELDVLDGVLCEVYYGLARIDIAQNDLKSAWQRALASWQIAERNPKPLHVGFAYRTVGRVIVEYDASPHPDFFNEPDTYFNRAIEAFREINAEAEVARTKFVQALAWAARGQRLSAARHLQQVMVIFTRLGMVGDAARAAEAQGQLL